MNLGFSTIFPKGKTLKGKRTGFVAKIKRGDKIHTIRADKNNRWKQGNKIHCFTGLRTKKCKLFYLGECKGTQQIKIIWLFEVHQTTYRNGVPMKRIKKYKNRMKQPVIFIDNKPLQAWQVEQLAKNDGFKNSAQFFEWFDTDFTGKIIHFTNHKY